MEIKVLDEWKSLLLGPGETPCRIVRDDADIDAEFLNSEGRWRSLFNYGGECAVLERLEQVLAERADLNEALAAGRSDALKWRETAHVLAKALFEAASGTLEGPEIEGLLEKAGLIEWTTFDSDMLAWHDPNCEVEDGDRIWLATDFADELLRHEDPREPHRSQIQEEKVNYDQRHRLSMHRRAD